MQETQIMVKVLDAEIPLAEFTLDDVPEILTDIELGGIPDPIGQLFTWLWDLVEEGQAWVVNTLKPVINAVKTWVYNNVTSFVQGVQDFIDNIVAGVRGVVDGITTTIGNVWTFLQSVYGYLKEMWAGLGSLVAGVVTQVTSFFDAIWTGFLDLGTTVGAWIQTGIKGFQDFWVNVQAFFTNAYNKLVAGVNDTILTLGGFVNTLGNISTWLTDLPRKVWTKVTDVFSTMAGAMASITKLAWNAITGFTGWLWGKAKDFAKWAWDSIVGAISFILTSIAKTFTGSPGTIVKAASTAGASLGTTFYSIITPILESTSKATTNFMEKLTKRVVAGRGKGEWAEFADMVGAILFAQVGFRYMAQALYWAGEVFKEVEIAPTIHLQFMSAGVSTQVPIKMTVGGILLHLASELKTFPDLLSKTMIFGIGHWIGKPYARIFGSMARNYLPVELPTLMMITEITRRHIPHSALPKFKKYIVETMSLYGFSDDVINWYTWKHDERFVPIVDRFGGTRRLPIGLLYDLPSGSDMCRMMVRDIFGPSEDPFPSFQKAISMRGYSKDTAMMYYLLHFRYPSMDRLYEFIARISAGFGWVTAKPKKEAGLGFGGSSPLNMSKKYMKTPIKSVKDLTAKLIPYAKWHDYAPFGWQGDFTSDRLIMTDLMAKIPTRIDARWMYKWAVIDDKKLMRITLATGMHPDWVIDVTIAEAMNALTEERTSARTGVMSTFKEGFSTESLITKTLSKLTTVKILGKDVTVKYLPSEVGLLTIRAKYNRAMDILKDYSKDVIRAYADNIMMWDPLTEGLEASTKEVASGLGIPLAFDSKYFDLYKPVADVLHDISTTRRVRSWIRYMMWRILARLSAGYMTQAEFEDFLGELKRLGKLSDPELDLMREVGHFMLAYAVRERKTSSILKKLGRGVITKEQALAELIQQGIDPASAEALIEDRAKTYVLSISTLLAYADMVEVPEELMKKKIETMGVPADEVSLILEVFKIKPIKSEMASYIRSLLDDFEDGYRTEEYAKIKLEELGKKSAEIKLLIDAAKVEKEAKTNKLMVDATINKLKRGAATLAETRTEMKKYIVDPELADAMIEKYAKIHAVSVEKLTEMAEYIPIPDGMLKAKMDVVGVPPDEQKLWPGYNWARTHGEELHELMRELGNLFVEGKMTKTDFKKELDDLATLWGKVKKQLGVDWVVYSPEERELLLMMYEVRRFRRLGS